jgi:hypothetical protein
MRSLKFLAPAVVAVTILCAPAAAGVTTLSGGAFGASLGGVVTVIPSPSVDLPSSGGGPFQQTLASVNVLGLLSTGVLNVSTQGSLSGNGSVDSSADVDNVAVPPVSLAADAVHSTCSYNAGSPGGSTKLDNGHLGGLSLPQFPAPNLTLSVPGVGYVKLNEQIPDNTPGMNGLTVNAIHVVINPNLPIQQDITISQSRCSAGGTPTAVHLRSFSAGRTAHGVLLHWRTGVDAGVLGFNVYRQQGLNKVKLNSGLVAGGSSVSGSSYSYLVRNAKAGLYWLQGVRADGRRVWFGSAAA